MSDTESTPWKQAWQRFEAGERVGGATKSITLTHQRFTAISNRLQGYNIGGQDDQGSQFLFSGLSEDEILVLIQAVQAGVQYRGS